MAVLGTAHPAPGCTSTKHTRSPQQLKVAARGGVQRVEAVQHNLGLEHGGVGALRPVQRDGAAHLRGEREGGGGPISREELGQYQEEMQPDCVAAGTQCGMGMLLLATDHACRYLAARPPIVQAAPHRRRPGPTCTTLESSGWPVFQSTPASTICSVAAATRDGVSWQHRQHCKHLLSRFVPKCPARLARAEQHYPALHPFAWLASTCAPPPQSRSPAQSPRHWRRSRGRSRRASGSASPQTATRWTAGECVG